MFHNMLNFLTCHLCYLDIRCTLIIESTVQTRAAWGKGEVSSGQGAHRV